MKLKYKKMTFIISMCVMCIGMLTLSMSHTSGRDKKKSIDTVKTETKKEPEEKEESSESDNIFLPANGKKDDGTLQKNLYPGINKLVQSYLDARASSNIEDLEKIISKTHSITLEALKSEAEYIEGYHNVSCYTLKSPKEESFVVYVYEELKIRNIDTLAPGMIRLYIRRDENGIPCIYFGSLNDEELKFIETSEKNKEVKNLVESVDKKLLQAVNKDNGLKVFVNQIEDISESDKKAAEKKNADTSNTSAKKNADSTKGKQIVNNTKKQTNKK